MAQMVVHLSLCCILCHIVNLVLSLELTYEPFDQIGSRNSFFIIFSAVQSLKGTSPSHGKILKGQTDHDSYLVSSKRVTTRQSDTSAETLPEVELAKIKADGEYCKMVCLDFNYFPIILDPDGRVSAPDQALFELHLDFLEFAETNKVEVMKACNSATHAPCMEGFGNYNLEILKIAEPETIPVSEENSEPNDQLQSPALGGSSTPIILFESSIENEGKGGSKIELLIIIVVVSVAAVIFIGGGFYIFQTRYTFITQVKNANL
ncbi:hypothetical protein RF11_08402 [Thelohanellus kitauei]|uniref:Uncharacterized protein n=1 Tax=Thelohanellus kitauei TaxID=669202 RepID=A0A0C2NFH9_THEKT|nr:hypothetical protein RF11_08402 [Thelohanellus kitauei]